MHYQFVHHLSLTLSNLFSGQSPPLWQVQCVLSFTPFLPLSIFLSPPSLSFPSSLSISPSLSLPLPPSLSLSLPPSPSLSLPPLPPFSPFYRMLKLYYFYYKSLLGVSMRILQFSFNQLSPFSQGCPQITH